MTPEVTILPKKGTQKRRLLDYILRKGRPVTMGEIKQAIDNKKLKDTKQMRFNIGPLLYSMCEGYAICKLDVPLLKVVKVKTKANTIANAFITQDYMTAKYVTECDKALERIVFERRTAKAKAVKVLKSNGDLIARSPSGKEILIGKKGNTGKMQEITPYRCCWCQDQFPDVNKAHLVLGVGWFCGKDGNNCIDEYTEQTSKGNEKQKDGNSNP